MLYAEDLSINGTVLSREYPTADGSLVRLDHQLNKSMGPVLLQDGDCLYFSNSTFVQYSELNPCDEFTMPLIMDCEVKVGWWLANSPLRGAHSRNSVFKKIFLSNLVSLVLEVKVECMLLGITTLNNKSHAKLSLQLAWT